MLKMLKNPSKFMRMVRYFGTKRMTLPKFADSVEEVTMTRYVVEPGEYVNEDDDIIEIESQKGSTFIKSSMSGMVSSYLVEIDADFNIGDEYCEIDIDAPKPDKKQATAAPPKEEKPKEAPKEAKTPTPAPAQPVKTAPAPEPKLEVSGKQLGLLSLLGLHDSALAGLCTLFLVERMTKLRSPRLHPKDVATAQNCR